MFIKNLNNTAQPFQAMITCIVMVVSFFVFPTVYAHNSIELNNTSSLSDAQNKHHHADEYLAQQARERNELPFQNRQAKLRGRPDQVGQWGTVKTWPFVFASAANLPDGRIMAWGGNRRTSFSGGKYTYTGAWDSTTDQITEYANNQHSMFCAVPTMRENGQVFVVGGDGSTRNRTSLFDYRTNKWTLSDTANTGRWYNGSLQLPNGQVFLALGSNGSRYPELWTEGEGWRWLTGIDLQAPILNYGSQYTRPNWFPQMSLTPSGDILHLGPTPKMHYIDTSENGSIREAGAGITDWHAHNQSGTSIMFDKGKVLTLGGVKAKNKATIVDMNGDTPNVTPVVNMTEPRAHANAVMLPTGEVFVVGGTSNDVWFSDSGSILTPEIWNPQSRTWRQVDNHSVPRNYHSVALLMTDGRVFSGGGGLCNCAADHPNHQIYSPSYLFNADGSLAARPVISNASDIVVAGQSIDIQVSSSIEKFTFVKMSGTTHSHNTDLRFLNIPFTGNNGQYQLAFENNPNVLTPGYWMLFAFNEQGTPSVAKVIQVRSVPPTIPSEPGPYRYVKLVAESEVNGGAWTSAAEVNVLDENGNNIDRTGWSVSTDSQEIGASAIYAIDGDRNTIWHTEYRTIIPRPPHQLIIDMGVGHNVGGFSYLPRQTGAANGGIASYNFYVSTDGVNWSQSLAQGVFTNDRSEKTVSFTGVTPIFNLARGKIAIQSSTYNDSSAAVKAVDGNSNGSHSHGSVTHTNRDLNAWWEVDLGQRYNLTTLRIFNRTDCCAERLSDFYVFVSDVPFASKELVATQNQPGISDLEHLGIAGQKTDFTLNRTGQFIRVQLGETNFLQLAEVEVMGTLGEAIELPTFPSAEPTAPKQVSSSIEYVASVEGGTGLRYKWLFGDGTPETDWSSSPKITHEFNNPGRYIITSTVQDSRGQRIERNFYQAIHASLSSNRPSHSMSVVYEEAGGNDRVWNVNPDNNTVGILDTVSNQKIGEVIVGQKPYSLAISPEGKVWVTNKKSSTISIIDENSLNVVKTLKLPFGSQPHGIVFAPNNQAVYVALEAAGKLIKLSSVGDQIGSVDLGTNVRHISVNADSSKVYVSRFITPTVQDEATGAPVVSNGGGEVVVVDANTMRISKTISLQHSNIPDVDSGGRGIPNYLGPAVINPNGLSAWIPSKQDNIARGTLRDGQNLNHENTVRSISSYVDLATAQEILGERIDHDNAGIANTALFGQYGNYLFVALEGTREIAVVDAYGKSELFRINTGHAPQGLAVSSNGKTLYVHNFMDRSISVYDISKLMGYGEETVAHVATINMVANEQLLPQVLLGKQLFYDSKDPRLAKDGYMSCATCHNEGGQDGRIWDVTGFGEGLRNTTDLNGRSGIKHGLLHWSANFDEVQDFESQIRSLSKGTGLLNDNDFQLTQDPLGAMKSGLNSDLDALAAYVNSLTTFDVSPNRNVDGSLTSAGKEGKLIFETVGCEDCHSGVHYTDSPNGNMHDIGTIKQTSGGRLGGELTGIDTPTLRGVWSSAPYLHDGSATSIEDAIKAHPDVVLTTAELNQLAAYIRQVDSLESGALPLPGNGNDFISIDGSSIDWAPVSPAIDTLGENTAPVDVEKLWLIGNEDKVYIAYQDRQLINPEVMWAWQVLIDTDYDNNTGLVMDKEVGADFLLSGISLYKYSGTGEDWNWTYITDIEGALNGNFAEYAIDRSFIGQSNKLKLTFFGANAYAGGAINDYFYVNKNNINGTNGENSGIVIDGDSSDWAPSQMTQDEPESEPEGTFPVDFQSVGIGQDDQNVYFSYDNRIDIDVEKFWAWLVLIDSDKQRGTGLNFRGRIGADYLLLGNSLYKYAGNGEDWNWTLIKQVSSNINGKFAELAINKSDIGNSNDFDAVFYGSNTYAGGMVDDSVYIP